MDDDVAQWATGRLLSAAARRIERAWDSHLGEWGLSHASFPVLFLLARSEHSQRELATAMGVTEQTMSRLLVRLEEEGLVRRAPHDADRRRHVVTLLPAGAAVVTAASDPRRVEALATRGMTPEQVANLRDALITLLAAWEEHGEPGVDPDSCPSPPLSEALGDEPLA